METREDDRKVVPVQANGKGAVPAGDAPGAADVPDERKGPPKRIIFGIVAVVAIVAALVWGVPWLSYSLSHEGTDDARVDSDVVAVTSNEFTARVIPT